MCMVWPGLRMHLKVEQLLSSDEDSGAITAVEEITSYVDGIISTINPAIAADGSGGFG